MSADDRNKMREAAGTFVFPEMKSLQKKILYGHRLSKEFCNEYGNEIIERFPNGDRVRAAIRMIKKYKGEDATIETHRDLIADMIYTRNVLGFYYYEYFSYGLDKLTPLERTEYISENARLSYYRKINTDWNGIRIFDNKWKSYETFKKWYKREIVKIEDSSDYASFVDFCTRHERFIVKAIDGALGKGVHLIDQAEYESKEALFHELLDVYASFKSDKQTAFLCEELIVGEESLAKFHPKSVNSVRIFTYFDGKETHVVEGWVKTGRGNEVVDNGTAGGILAGVDIKTGVISSDGRNSGDETYETHPDTGYLYKGSKIEKWDELMEMAKEIACVLPGVPLVGWDIGLSKEKGWQVIEGNAWGMFNMAQVINQKGMRAEFERKIEWSKHK